MARVKGLVVGGTVSSGNCSKAITIVRTDTVVRPCAKVRHQKRWLAPITEDLKRTPRSDPGDPHEPASRYVGPVQLTAPTVTDHRRTKSS
jgi:hypothetical protein